MIYQFPVPEEPIDQGDIIQNCPIVQVVHFDLQNPTSPQVSCSTSRVVVLTQTCDLANQKTQRVTVALVHDAQYLVDQNIMKAADVRGPIRAGRVFGWYFLPRLAEAELAESIVDFRQVHTIPFAVIQTLFQSGHRLARIQPLFREHLARHFADTFSRIGLPHPYETE